MASRLNPYISFNGDARQAMEFYKGVFGGELNVNTYGDQGPADGVEGDKVMHSMLETDAGYTIMASDSPPHVEYNPGKNFAMSLSGDDADRLHGYWESLSDGGTVQVPLEKQAWGDEFGMVTDKFGIDWMVNVSPS